MGQRLRRQNTRRASGFTLIEAVIGIALVAIAVLGLAQMFTLSVMNNFRSDRITTASFLAQQRVDVLRTLTAGELEDFRSSGYIDLNNDGRPDFLKDELIDLNGDGTNDFRRLTRVRVFAEFTGTAWEVDVLIFSAEQFNKNESALWQDPQRHRVRARVSTIISR